METVTLSDSQLNYLLDLMSEIPKENYKDFEFLTEDEKKLIFSWMGILVHMSAKEKNDLKKTKEWINDFSQILKKISESEQYKNDKKLLKIIEILSL